MQMGVMHFKQYMVDTLGLYFRVFSGLWVYGFNRIGLFLQDNQYMMDVAAALAAVAAVSYAMH